MQKLSEIPLARIRAAEAPGRFGSSEDEAVEACPMCDGARFVRGPWLFGGVEAIRRVEPCPSCNPMPAAIGIDNRVADATFESFDLKLNRSMVEAVNQCKKVAAGEAWCALLNGNPGLGKSHLAAAALNASIHPRPGRWWNFGELLRHIQRVCFDKNGPELNQETVLDALAKQRGLLVVDDVGAEKPSEWTRQTLYAITNPRYDLRLPTIITTNNPDAIDERVLSRYFEGTIDCEGRDVRKLPRKEA